MTVYRVIENGFGGCEYGTLFQSRAFFNLHSRSNSSFFELSIRGRIRACIHFTQIDDSGTWRSPARGTFAGLWFEDGLKTKDLLSFLNDVELSLRSKGAKVIEILPAPQAHNEAAFARQFYLLRMCGFEMVRCDLNQSLKIDDRSLADRMSYGNLKRLRKCERGGLVATKLLSSELERVYDTLLLNRRSKGHCLSMTLAELETMLHIFPQDVIMYGCVDGDYLAAAAFCLRLSSEVLYVFYWGDRPEYASYSPVVVVADAVYRHGQEQGYKVMDVGTSTIDREPNFGLLEFKQGLGFTESLKLILRKSL